MMLGGGEGGREEEENEPRLLRGQAVNKGSRTWERPSKEEKLQRYKAAFLCNLLPFHLIC